MPPPGLHDSPVVAAGGVNSYDYASPAIRRLAYCAFGVDRRAVIDILPNKRPRRRRRWSCRPGSGWHSAPARSSCSLSTCSCFTATRTSRRCANRPCGRCSGAAWRWSSTAWIWWWFGARARGVAVLHRLSGRVVVVDGQRVRVRGDLRLLRRAAEVPVPRAVLGHPGRDRDAAHVYPGGGELLRALRMDLLHLRRVSDLHGHQTGHGARRRDASGSEHRAASSPAGICVSPRARTATSFLSARTASCLSPRCFWCCW